MKILIDSVIKSYLLLDPPASKPCSEALTFSLIHLWYTRIEVMDVPSKNTIPKEITDTLIAIWMSFFLCALGIISSLTASTFSKWETVPGVLAVESKKKCL